MSVVFPAPFGPKYPNAHPRGTRSSTPFTAVFSPNRLTRPWVSTAHWGSGACGATGLEETVVLIAPSRSRCRHTSDDTRNCGCRPTKGRCDALEPTNSLPRADLRLPTRPRETPEASLSRQHLDALICGVVHGHR